MPIVSDTVYDLVHAKDTVSSVLASTLLSQNQSQSSSHSDSPSDSHSHSHSHSHASALTTPTPTVQSVAESLGLEGKHVIKRGPNLKIGVFADAERDDLDRVVECGRFGVENGGGGGGGGRRPSDLFLKMYGEVLRTYDIDPLANLVSPPLSAAMGVVPLTIISVIPDIMAHYADCIVRAEKEVFFATNYWEASTAATVITDALRELSRRAWARGDRVVVKIMYDRGNLKQICDPHQIVPVDEYTADAVKLPHPSEIPNVDLEVCNYHQPLLGTFHAKYAVIDRKIALINSNNTQDRVNMEMMCHVEGPIVDSFYDMALLSWSNALSPPLPCLLSPLSTSASSSASASASASIDDTQQGEQEYKFGKDHPHLAEKDVGLAKVNAEESLRSHAFPEGMVGGVGGGGVASGAGAGVGAGAGTPGVGISDSKQEQGQAQEGQSEEGGGGRTYDSTLNEEKKRYEAGLHEGSMRAKLAAVTKHLNTTLQPSTISTLPLPSSTDVDFTDFTPHILHAPHAPFPIAMVNRRPRGAVEYTDTNNPQDVAWLAGFWYARERVFVQTPTFNAPAVVDATLAAVRRGVEVVLYINLGYNDGGESLPYQGGTNEVVVAKMYKDLEKEKEKRGLLKVYWYTAKDMARPVNASKKQRNCHVKLMIVDGCIGIMGNGNQDSQSWYHSQEANIMIDSSEICKDWEEGIRANQNTHLYGRLDEDGIWRDPKDGSVLEDMGTTKGGVGAVAKGLVDAVKRVQGKGGF